jgi:phosphoglycolate phosphatase
MEGRMMAAIVFDLDGTLIDSVPDIHFIANEVLNAEGAEPITLAQARSFVGNGAGVFVQKMRALRGLPDADQDRLYEAFVGLYDTAVTRTVPYPGVPELLARLKGDGHRLGVCTNKPISPTKAVLAHLGLDMFFDTVWGGDSLPVRKPDPAPLHAAFEALGEEIRLYVGDSEVDADTAKAAGVPFFLYTEGYRKTLVEEISHRAAFSHFDALYSQLTDVMQAAAP